MVLLSFDIEEFDVPIEYGKTISLEEQIRVSKEGTSIILDLLKEYNIRATFFCTVVFAENALDIIKRIVDEGHELASHGYAHSSFKYADLKASKDILEIISGASIQGFRMARMVEINSVEVYNAGYLYNSSINPTFIPGRYNYYKKPRLPFVENKILQIPVSVTPFFRIPLFWLSFHNLPFSIYMWLTKITMRKDKYIHVYFHPWEFIDLSDNKYGLPKYISKNTGVKMEYRFKRYLKYFYTKKISFITLSEFQKEHI